MVWWVFVFYLRFLHFWECSLPEFLTCFAAGFWLVFSPVFWMHLGVVFTAWGGCVFVGLGWLDMPAIGVGYIRIFVRLTGYCFYGRLGVSVCIFFTDAGGCLIVSGLLLSCCGWHVLGCL